MKRKRMIHWSASLLDQQLRKARNQLRCVFLHLLIFYTTDLSLQTSVALTHDNSDASIYDDEPRAPFTQCSEARPVPRPRPVPKRKAADVLEVESASSIEDFDAVASDRDLLSDVDDYSMEVDSTHADLKPETSQPVANLKQDPALLMKTLSKSQKACRTTNSVRTQFSHEFPLTHIYRRLLQL